MKVMRIMYGFDDEGPYIVIDDEADADVKPVRVPVPSRQVGERIVACCFGCRSIANPVGVNEFFDTASTLTEAANEVILALTDELVKGKRPSSRLVAATRAFADANMRVRDAAAELGGEPKKYT